MKNKITLRLKRKIHICALCSIVVANCCQQPAIHE